MLYRVLAIAILLFSILFMPFWLSAILGLSAILYFSWFLEITFLFLLSDLIFASHTAKFDGGMFVSFVISILVLIILELFKKQLKFYA